VCPNIQEDTVDDMTKSTTKLKKKNVTQGSSSPTSPTALTSNSTPNSSNSSNTNPSSSSSSSGGGGIRSISEVGEQAAANFAQSVTSSPFAKEVVSLFTKIKEKTTQQS
jgi:hypothetical protein